ncbi:hypothetical protein OIU74_026511, partial [Salix koriyanagi]
MEQLYYKHNLLQVRILVHTCNRNSSENIPLLTMDIFCGMLRNSQTKYIFKEEKQGTKYLIWWKAHQSQIWMLIWCMPIKPLYGSQMN